MPARLQPLATGTYYHLFNRGVNKARIFLDSKDYRRAIETLAYYQYTRPPLKYSYFLTLPPDQQRELWEKLTTADDRLVDLVAYVLMPNHYHLLVRQRKDGGISRCLANWQDSLARFINTRHDRVGPLFQGPFRAVPIEDDAQLLHLSRYIHLNPYTAAVLSFQQLPQYPWSSLGTYLGKERPPHCQTGIVLSQFSDPADYQTFVLDRADYQRSLRQIKRLAVEQ